MDEAICYENNHSDVVNVCGGGKETVIGVFGDRQNCNQASFQ
jgi:hypothetical protein